MAPKQFCVGLSHLSHFVPANHYTHWYVIMYIFMCIITGQPTLSVGGQAINGRWCLSSSSLTLPGTWAVGRPTLHGGPVQLRPVSATPCYSLLLLLGCIRCGLLLQMSHVAWFVCLCVGQTNVLCKNGWTDRDAVRTWLLWAQGTEGWKGNAAFCQITLGTCYYYHCCYKRIVIDLRPCDHVTPAVIELHWLPVAEQIQ